jgi:hypothetical protein
MLDAMMPCPAVRGRSDAWRSSTAQGGRSGCWRGWKRAHRRTLPEPEPELELELELELACYLLGIDCSLLYHYI